MREAAAARDIPPPLPSDDDDVHWALSTAISLWQNGSHDDALRWLSRAQTSAVHASALTRASQIGTALTRLRTSMRPPPANDAPPVMRAIPPPPPPPSVRRPVGVRAPKQRKSTAPMDLRAPGFDTPEAAPAIPPPRKSEPRRKRSRTVAGLGDEEWVPRRALPPPRLASVPAAAPASLPAPKAAAKNITPRRFEAEHLGGVRFTVARGAKPGELKLVALSPGDRADGPVGILMPGCAAEAEAIATLLRGV